MRKPLIFACLWIPLMASAWNVGTEPTRRNALIEEFTGIHCQNCPDGHRVAAALTALHPDDVYTVAIHAGGFANPYPTEPDFITETGTAIHDHFGISSYPCAVVNRKDTGYGLVQGRSTWGSACREIMRLDSPVNLWASSEYDPSEGLFRIDVEAYFTDSMENPRLNVFLLQNEIAGPQSGGLLGNEYPHRHMLRCRLTDNDFGDPIDNAEKGSYWARSFSYILPDNIGGVATDPVNTEFLIFVTDGDNDVVKVCATRPDTSELPQPFIVSTSAAPISITKNYALDYVEIYLNNHGGTDVTSASFDVTLNGETETVEWTGLVPPHTAGLIQVPVGENWRNARDKEANQYVLRMVRANGNEVETASIRGSFNEIFTYPASLTVKIKTDSDAADNTWRIIDANGETVKQFGPYPDGIADEYTDTVELEPDSVYGLEITDCWGDGIMDPMGYIKLIGPDGRQVTQIKEITGYGMRQFFRTEADTGVESYIAEPLPVHSRYYDLSGREISAPCGGTYIVRTIYTDGSVRTTKSIID